MNLFIILLAIDWNDKFANLIVTLMGTGIGWFVANKIFNALKHSSFEIKIVILTDEHQSFLPNHKEKRFEFWLKNSSTVIAYNVKVKFFFRKNTSHYVEAEISQLDPYQVFSEILGVHMNDNLTWSQFMHLFERFEVNYVTQYGYEKQYISSDFPRY